MIRIFWILGGRGTIWDAEDLGIFCHDIFGKDFGHNFFTRFLLMNLWDFSSLRISGDIEGENCGTFQA